MSQQCSWPTHSWPLEGRCPYYALLGLTQAPGLAGGHDYSGDGIVTKGVENNIRNIGALAREGMRETDKTIIRMMIGDCC